MCSQYTIPLLNNLSSKTKAPLIREELVKHNHIARKYVDKKLKLKSKKEAMSELKMHYDKCHNTNSSFLSINSSLISLAVIEKRSDLSNTVSNLVTDSTSIYTKTRSINYKV